MEELRQSWQEGLRVPSSANVWQLSCTAFPLLMLVLQYQYVHCQVLLATFTTILWLLVLGYYQYYTCCIIRLCVNKTYCHLPLLGFICYQGTSILLKPGGSTHSPLRSPLGITNAGEFLDIEKKSCIYYFTRALDVCLGFLWVCCCREGKGWTLAGHWQILHRQNSLFQVCIAAHSDVAVCFGEVKDYYYIALFYMGV